MPNVPRKNNIWMRLVHAAHRELAFRMLVENITWACAGGSGGCSVHCCLLCTWPGLLWCTGQSTQHCCRAVVWKPLLLWQQHSMQILLLQQSSATNQPPSTQAHGTAIAWHCPEKASRLQARAGSCPSPSLSWGQFCSCSPSPISGAPTCWGSTGQSGAVPPHGARMPAPRVGQLCPPQV